MRSLLLSTLAFGCLALTPAAMAQAQPQPSQPQAGQPQASQPQAGKCEDLFAVSRAMADVVSTAYDAIGAKDQAKQKSALPALEAVLKPLPAAEIKPAVCNGNHIDAYTTYQYAELSVLRARNLDTGFPADLPIVKQPELNHSSAAYAAGWIKYELGDFNGALEAFAKGLAMFPYNASLQNEYVATLMQLKRYKDLVAFTDNVIEKGFDLSDTDRAKLYLARAYGLFSDGDKAGAKDSVTVSIRYNDTDDAQSLLEQIEGK